MKDVQASIFVEFIFVALGIWAIGLLHREVNNTDRVINPSRWVALGVICVGAVVSYLIEPIIKIEELSRQPIDVPMYVTYNEKAYIAQDNDRIECEIRIDNNSDTSYYVVEKASFLWESANDEVLYIGTKGDTINISNTVTN